MRSFGKRSKKKTPEAPAPAVAPPEEPIPEWERRGFPTAWDQADYNPDRTTWEDLDRFFGRINDEPIPEWKRKGFPTPLQYERWLVDQMTDEDIAGFMERIDDPETETKDR